MAKNHRNQLAVAIAGTVFGLSAIVTQFTSQAQAAVLTYNFQTEFEDEFVIQPPYSDTYHAPYNGSFSFDNSSLTGIGDESVSVLSGVFNHGYAIYPRPIVQYPSSYPLSATSTDMGRWLGEISGASVNIRNGRLLGITFTGNNSFGHNFASAQITWKIHNNTYVANEVWYTGGSGNLLNTWSVQSNVIYTDPEFVVSQPVPEPSAIAGLALGLASLVGIRQNKKQKATSLQQMM
jgi:PEP-CTERM motif